MVVVFEYGVGFVKCVLLIGLLLILLLLIGVLLVLFGICVGNFWLLDWVGFYLFGELSVENWCGNLFFGVDVGVFNYC